VKDPLNPLGTPKKTSARKSVVASTASRTSQVSNHKVESQAESLKKIPSIEPKLADMPPMYSPYPDNSDNTSSVSFNTGVLYDQFDNMDSISQVMANDQDSNSGALDLKNVGAEISKRDKKIQDLLSDRQKLKNLLKKAKTAIDSINLKYKGS